MQTQMGYWEWPEWSIVLICVLFLVLVAVYVFVVGVLIVENNPELREFINIHLAKLGGVLSTEKCDFCKSQFRGVFPADRLSE